MEFSKQKIKSLGQIITGKTPRTARKDFFGGEFPFITIPDLNGRVIIDTSARTLSHAGADSVRNSKLPSGAVMMSCIATVGKCGITSRISFTNQQINSVIPNKNVNSFYLYYAFKLIGDELERFGGGGSVYTNVSKSRFADIEIPVPSLTEQIEIVSILSALDKKIEMNRQMNKTLEAMARALFKDWFVDFGPTRAKMEGREPYLAREIWDLFPDKLDDEGKPEGWLNTKLKDSFHLTMGQSPPGDTYNEDGEGLPFFQGRKDFRFRYPKNRKYCKAPTRIANRDDTLVSVRAPVGDINMAWDSCCIGRGVASLRHISESRSFTYYAVWEMQSDLKQYEHTGTVFGAIGKEQFKNMDFVDPQANIVALFENQFGVIDERIRNNIAESSILAQTRDILLPRLISGELRVKN